MRIPRTVLIPLIVVGATTASLSLSGCVSGLVDGAVEGGLEQILEEQTGGELDLDISGEGNAEIPAEWPASVPLPPGNPTTSSSFGGLMSITYTVGDIDEALAHSPRIESAGFPMVSEQSYNGGSLWAYTDGTIRVIYQVTDSGEGDGSALSMISIQPESE